MRPTDILKSDHREMLLAVSILNTMCAGVEKEGEAEPGDFRRLIDYVTNFGFGYHSANEDVLFNALRAHGVDSKTTALGRLQGDHVVYRRSMDDVLANLDAAEKGDGSVWDSIVRECRYTMEHIEEHMKQEEYILYYMADIYLPEQEQQRLLRAFTAMESDLIRSGKRAVFDDILSTLAAKYSAGDSDGINDFGLSVDV